MRREQAATEYIPGQLGIVFKNTNQEIQWTAPAKTPGHQRLLPAGVGSREEVKLWLSIQDDRVGALPNTAMLGAGH